MKRILLIATIFAAALSVMFSPVMSVSSGEEGNTTETPTRQAAAKERLPDLGMARLRNFSIDDDEPQQRLLRFDSIVVNTGSGPFEVRGSRSSSSASTMSVRQHIYNSQGGRRNVPTTASMYFGGDGHNHWHVRDLEHFSLRRIEGNTPVRTGAKHGFCFFDNYRYGSDRGIHYRSCGDSDDLVVTMGLSRGWGDIYSASLPDQYVNITGLPDGKYRMTGVADKQNWFRESNNRNNVTTVDLKIVGDRVRVISYGPAARSIR